MTSQSETKRQAGGQRRAKPPGLGYLLRVEVLGEVLLLALAGFLFGLMLWESREWSEGAARVPRLAAAIGIPFWLLRAYTVLKPPKQGERGMIMDMGFVVTGEEKRVLARRWGRFLGMVAGLVLGVWLFGFHIWVPFFIFVTLIAFGKMKWYWTLPFVAFFVAILLGMYGYVLNAPWHEPPVFTLWRAIFGGG